MKRTQVSVVSCPAYEPNLVRHSVTANLAPLGGISRFVRPGMQVLLKPNLLAAAEPEQAVTTHPIVVQAVAELVQQAGGTVLIGDSPAGPIENNPLHGLHRSDQEPLWRHPRHPGTRCPHARPRRERFLAGIGRCAGTASTPVEHYPPTAGGYGCGAGTER